MLSGLVQQWALNEIREIIKAVYTGAGYSAVADPEDEELWLGQATQEWHRTGLETLKRRGECVVDGNTVRVEAPADVGGEPTIKLVDVATFNTQDELERWLAKMNMRSAGPGRYQIIPELVEEDNTWLR
jgi:hypothetical protein